jgi:hypothetical protein
MLALARLAIGQCLRRAQDAVIALEKPPDAADPGPPSPSNPSTGSQASHGLTPSPPHATRCPAPHRRESARSPPQPTRPRPCERNRIWISSVRGRLCTCQTPLNPLQQPRLRRGIGSIVRRRFGAKLRKASGKIAHESRRLVELQPRDHAPRQLVAAKDVGQRLQLRLARRESTRIPGARPASMLQGRSWRRAQFHPCGRFVLVGSDQTVEQAEQQQSADHKRNQFAPAHQNRPNLAQRC